MLRAPLGQSPLFDGRPRIEKLSSPPEKDIRWGQIIQRLVIAVLVVMVNEGCNRPLEFTGKVIVCLLYTSPSPRD